MSSSSIDKRIGLCLSGGGSRAMAFHLGCLRALNRYGLLDNVTSMSTVSGGSVIGAMYVYNNGSFEDFEKEVRKFLKRGLFWDAMKYLFLYLLIIPILLNFLLVFPLYCLVLVASFFKIPKKILNPMLSVPRIFNRAWALSKVLKHMWFKDKYLSSSRRNNIDLIINATSLRSLTAVRFGHKYISCWPFGKASSQNVDLSLAVMASAAYPVFLPCLAPKFEFESKGKTKNIRLSLTDGGIYENLGLTPLLPNRDENFSYKTSDVDYLIACDAGNAVRVEDEFPIFISSRLSSCFNSVMRRVQSSNFNLLFKLKEEGVIKGFILAHLSQDDKNLNPKSLDFVTRDDVGDYPTDFFRMPDEDMNNLILRGESLIESLVPKYIGNEFH